MGETINEGSSRIAATHGVLLGLTGVFQDIVSTINEIATLFFESINNPDTEEAQKNIEGNETN
jgi:hypothetical protein